MDDCISIIIIPVSLACHRMPSACRKNVALYACYVLVIASAAGVGLGAALNWPGMVKGSLVQLLLLILLTWAAVAASTAGLKIGSDG